MNIFHGTTDSGHELVLVVTGHRHVLAIELVAALAAQDVIAEVKAARERLADFGPGSSFALAVPADDPVLAPLPDNEPATEGSGSGDALTWPVGFAELRSGCSPGRSRVTRKAYCRRRLSPRCAGSTWKP